MATGSGINPLPPAAVGFAEVFGGTIPRPEDPGVEVSDGAVRNAWLQLGNERLIELCNSAYNDGDFGYVSTALKVNHEDMRSLLNEVNLRGGTIGEANMVAPQETYRVL